MTVDEIKEKLHLNINPNDIYPFVNAYEINDEYFNFDGELIYSKNK